MIRALQAIDAPALSALFADAGASCGLFTDPAPGWLASPSGDEDHTLGRWVDGALIAALRLQFPRRIRLRHLANLTLLGRDAALLPLLEAAVRFVDDLSPIDRLQLGLPTDHPAFGELSGLGFVAELNRPGRLPGGRSDAVFGRLRPSFAPRPAGPHPSWPPPQPPLPGAVALRLPTDDDAEAVRVLSTEPASVWGTLQSPYASEEYYRRRSQNTPADNHICVITVDGATLGMGGLHPTGVPGVASLGMALCAAGQGRGLGRALLKHLIEEARARGNRRLELAVWEDNHRALALYLGCGFVSEGRTRWDGLRAGGHGSSFQMALTLETP